MNKTIERFLDCHHHPEWQQKRRRRRRRLSPQVQLLISLIPPLLNTRGTQSKPGLATYKQHIKYL